LNKKLAILLLAALLFASFSTLPALTVKADTSEVNILSYSWYFSPISSTNALATYAGDVVVVGEIQNVGSSTIDYAVVSVDASNSTGIVASDSSRVGAHNIPPGGKSPFYIDLSPLDIEPPITDQSQNWLPTVDHVTASVIAVSDTSQTQYAGLSIVGQNGIFDSANGIYKVSGNVVNSGAQTASNLYILATFYNSSGSVVAVNSPSLVASSVAPGASLVFTTAPADNTAALSSQVSTFSLIIQSTAGSSTPTAVPTQAPTAVPSSQPTTSSQPSGSSQPTQTPPPASLTDILLIVLIAVAVVVVVAVAFVIVRMRRKNAVATANLPPPP
jgi:hypothetical protein